MVQLGDNDSRLLVAIQFFCSSGELLIGLESIAIPWPAGFNFLGGLGKIGFLVSEGYRMAHAERHECSCHDWSRPKIRL